jgi:hypothetical protein
LAGSFLVEDFLHAITAQLDRTQDALRVKALNRPLTYAIKDFALELKVFVDMDGSGNVRFRPSGPNETGASTVQIGFTTITRPMIEENTVSLAVTRSPTLEELGLQPEERQQLERLGVRNAAELRRLHSSAGTDGVARLSSIPVERLRAALQMGQPRLRTVGPAPAPAPAPVAHFPAPAHQPPPVRAVPAPVAGRPRPTARLAQPTPGRLRPPLLPDDRNDGTASAQGDGGAAPAPVIRLAPDARRLRLTGENLFGEGGPPEVRLDGRPLNVREVDDRQVVLDLPEGAASGALEVALPGGEVVTYQLSFEAEGPGHGAADPWAPGGGAS